MCVEGYPQTFLRPFDLEIQQVCFRNPVEAKVYFFGRLIGSH
jgi:hypothetical protein